MGFFDFLNVSKYKTEIINLQRQVSDLQQNNEDILKKNIELNNRWEKIGGAEIERLSSALNYKQKELQDINSSIASSNEKINELNETISSLKDKISKLDKQQGSQENKIKKYKELYRSVEYSVNYCSTLSDSEKKLFEELAPSIMLKLHYMDVKDLRKAYKENEKDIDTLLELYSSRYTTKSNKSIYNLMVIALRAELQNIIYNLKYEKLDTAISQVKSVCSKYLIIAGEGNQSIVGTLTKFIGEIEYLFINAVKIEYNYYVKKEQARQEQLAIKEQMRQEAQERKALETEKKKIEKEEEKYKLEILKLKEQLAQAQEQAQAELNSRILELEAQLSDVIVKKDEIVNLQNGKAGYVYVISNLGSFGDNMFKIGMTRRADPQDRIDELGSASVPFKFDVHSFIFSDDAVGLESKLHTLLNNQRVNKVNLRKEFFYSTLDELEQLVNDVDPTAEFNKTMLAEEFKQSQSPDYINTFYYDDEDEEEYDND